MRNFFTIIPLLLATMLLSACDGQFAGFNIGGDASPIERFDGDNGDVELRLDPVDVWEGIDVESIKMEVDGRELYVRKRAIATFERAWVRVGAFWNSKTDDVFIPIVVLGAPVEIRGLQMRGGKIRALLKKVDNIHFKPGSKLFDSDNRKSSAVFKMPLRTFKAVTSSKVIQVVVQTNRGNLAAGLDVITGDSTDALHKNAKNLFVQFYNMVLDIKKST